MNLYLEGQPAVIKSGTSFKVTRQNPFFADQGDYSFDVTLPLAGCAANQQIFGLLHRPETPLASLVGLKISMQLFAPPLNLTGYAQITNITDEEAKVQLIAGRSALTHAIEDDETYVDALSLGRCWDTFPEFSDGYNSWQPGASTDEMARMFHFLPQDTAGKVDVNTIAHGTYDKTDAVSFPIYCKTADAVANPWLMGSLPTFLYRVEFYKPESADATSKYTLVAPQPYLLDIAQRVIRAAGYSIGEWTEYTSSPLAQSIIIANSRVTVDRAKTLPHWTLSEFLTQMQNFFGCVFTVNGTTVDMKRRSSWYNDSAVRTELNAVSDELSTDIETDGDTADSSSGNVDYKWPDEDSMLRLPDEVWENATILELADYTAITNAFLALTDDEKAESQYLYKSKANGRTYAILHRHDTGAYTLARVDHYAPLIRDASSRDISTELKIVPATLDVCTGYYDTTTSSGPSTFNQGTTADGVPILVGHDTTLTNRSKYSVDEAVNSSDDTASSEEYTDTTKDTLEVAWYDGTAEAIVSDSRRFPIPIATVYTKNTDTALYVRPSKLSFTAAKAGTDGVFALSAQAGTYGNIGTLLANNTTVDSRCQHLFQFYDNVPLDPTVPYLIKGRLYACYKLEITIDEHGVQPLKKGYFCEIH